MPRRISLVAQTVAVLRKDIEAGRWHRWLPGEHILCGYLHVSRVTLRAALIQLQRGGWLRASQGKRREVLAKGHALKGAGANRSVILLTPEPLTSLPAFAVCWIDGLREQLSSANLRLEIHVSRNVYGARCGRALSALWQNLQPAAWIPYRSTYSMQRWFSASALPCVIPGTRHRGVELPCVDIDYRAVCRHAAGLALARGHRRLALLNPETGTGGEWESEEGFREAVGQTRVPGVDATVVRHDGTVAGICARLDALFRKTAPPTALLVSRPVHVLTAMGHLMRRGIRLPQDAVLISRDDDSFLEHVVPSIARYSCNPSDFAQKLSRLILDAAEGGTLSSADHRIMPHFVRGETFI